MAHTPPPANSSPQHTRKAWSVLIVSTLAFTVCFMVWMMFGVIGIPIKKMLDLSSTQFGLLMAMPVLTGSLVRVPLGIWTDKYGGRIVMAAVMATTLQRRSQHVAQSGHQRLLRLRRHLLGGTPPAIWS